MSEKEILTQLKVAEKDLEKAREKRKKALNQYQIFDEKYDYTFTALLDVKEEHEKALKYLLKAKKKYKETFEKLKKAEEKNQKAWIPSNSQSIKHSEAWAEYKKARGKVKFLSNKLESLRDKTK